VRATLYMMGLIWSFFAVAIVADAFMRGVVRITSKTRVIQVADPNTKTTTDVEVKVWNDTVANLTLLAFGTSAPEILLSVIEIVGGNFKAGPLGPGTIVGSAAFNLLIITPICIMSIPTGETRRIENFKVFALTTCSSIFAYLWLVIVLVAFSPGIVEVWEAVITFLMFPGLIMSAYAVDRNCCMESESSKSELGDLFLDQFGDLFPVSDTSLGLERNNYKHRYYLSFDISLYSNHSRVMFIYHSSLQELERDPSLSVDQAAKVATAKLAANQHHSSLWYRVNATRVITGGSKLMYENLQPDAPARLAPSELEALSEGGKKSVVEFTASSCSVLENEGSVRIGIRRFGNTSLNITVSVETIDGSAESNSDYVPFSGTVTFKSKEVLKEIFIKIIDDDVWEPDEFFFVKLFLTEDQKNVALGKTSINQVTIVNDDGEPYYAIWIFISKPSYIVKESSDFAMLNVNRINGADGEASVVWTTKDLTAKSGVEYFGGEGNLTFKHGEASKVLSIQINRIMVFFFQISTSKYYIIIFTSSHYKNQISKWNYLHHQGALRLETRLKSLSIINTGLDINFNLFSEFNHMVSRIANKTEKNLEGLKLDTGSWAEQFHDAFNVNGGDAENSSALDYIMHFITFFWKVLFAFIPPPTMGGGWFTLIIALVFIAFFTAIISDLASIFGCLIELSPTITALTFVALGTSMPDTFASKLAAQNEKTADSSIGNINGSNSVNVFLGLGMPWVIASIYWEAQGLKFEVPSGSLVFSVILYTACSFLALFVLMLRRNLSMFGRAELGGPSGPKIFTAVIIMLSWVFYVVLSSLQA
ncbi:hypothetical protein LOTGIDRAFT_71451, partial [Lottia gigantea]